MSTPKKPMSGCAIAAVVIGGLLSLGCIVSAVLVGIAAQKPNVRRAISMVSKGGAAMVKAKSAPGTAELRAAGCVDAWVIDGAALADDFDEFFDGGSTAGVLKMFVNCHSGHGAMTCDQVAEIYRVADGVTPGPFKVTVTRAGQTMVCEQDYES